jgi:preprotein translocase subunit YajC
MYRNTLLSALFGLIVMASNAQAQGAQGGDAFSSFVPLIVIFGIFYFLVIRPQQKRAKEHDAQLKALKKDDKIITSGGIYGTITAVRENILEVKIADNVRVQLSRSAVSDVIKDASEKAVEVVTPTIVK